MIAQAARFERVEWIYDGLNGKIIPWTKANGGTSDDPSVLVFVVGHDGKVIEKAPDGESHQPRAFAQFLKRHADAWERTHPRMKVPFLPAEITAVGEGAARTVTCRALEDAKAEKAPAAVYVGRKGLAADDAKAKAEAAACRKFEKESLSSAEAARAAEGWALVVLDRSDPDQAILAKSLGVESAPTVVLVVPGETKPVLLEKTISGGGLALQFKKYGTTKGK